MFLFLHQYTSISYVVDLKCICIKGQQKRTYLLTSYTCAFLFCFTIYTSISHIINLKCICIKGQPKRTYLLTFDIIYMYVSFLFQYTSISHIINLKCICIKGQPKRTYLLTFDIIYMYVSFFCFRIQTYRILLT